MLGLSGYDLSLSLGGSWATASDDEERDCDVFPMLARARFTSKVSVVSLATTARFPTRRLVLATAVPAHRHAFVVCHGPSCVRSSLVVRP